MKRPPNSLRTRVEQQDSQSTLQSAIIEAKKSPKLLKPGAPSWADPTWCLDSLVSKSSAAAPSCTIPIGQVGPTGKRTANVDKPYSLAWGDLLKCLIIWRLEDAADRGVLLSGGTVSAFALAVRHLVDCLVTTHGFESIVEVSKKEIYAFFQHVKHPPKFRQSKLAITTLIIKGITPQLSGLSLQMPKQHKNLPSKNVHPSSWSEVVALGEAYAQMTAASSALVRREDYDFIRYYTMLATLLACAPSRVSELWRLAADTAVITAPVEQLGKKVLGENAEDLDFRFGLVWHPVKNGRPIIKPIPSAMQVVAQNCVEVIRSYGEEPRATARWMLKNPGIIPIPDEMADLRECRKTRVISTGQIKRLLDFEEGGPLLDSFVWSKSFPRTRSTRQRKGRGTTQIVYYDYDEMQTEWWQEFQKRWLFSFGVEWPHSVKTETYKLTADRTLLLTFSGALTPRVRHKSKIFLDAPSRGSLDSLLGGNGGLQSLFERLNVRLPSGKYPSIRSHDLRHFLNTMAQRAGIPEPLIALWSGRASIAQNVTYDHRTDAERLRAHAYQVNDYDQLQVDDLLARQVEQTFSGTIASPSIQVLSASEQTVKELNKRLMISITQFGFCVGDLKSDPCPHAVNCLSCMRLMVCKGADKAEALIVQKIQKLEIQYGILLRHVQSDRGRRIHNSKILPHMRDQIDGARDMLMALRDPEIPNGSLIARVNTKGGIEGSFADRVTQFASERRDSYSISKELRDGRRSPDPRKG